jgi:hypothetical protein
MAYTALDRSERDKNSRTGYELINKEKINTQDYSIKEFLYNVFWLSFL